MHTPPTTMPAPDKSKYPAANNRRCEKETKGLCPYRVNGGDHNRSSAGGPSSEELLAYRHFHSYFTGASSGLRKRSH